jgi:A/G-specific adenine glycosylase
MQGDCIAARDIRQAQLPSPKRRRLRTSREATLLLAEIHGEDGRAILLQRRPAEGIWGGLWTPPQFECTESALAWACQEFGDLISAPEKLAPIDHAFTHFDLRIHPLRVRCTRADSVREADAQLWYTLDTPQRVGLPQPIKSLLDRVRDSPIE